jgi:hypothetical protein
VPRARFRPGKAPKLCRAVIIRIRGFNWRHPSNGGCAGVRYAGLVNFMFRISHQTPFSSIPSGGLRSNQRPVCAQHARSGPDPGQQARPPGCAERRGPETDLRTSLDFLNASLRTADRPWRQFGRVGIAPTWSRSKRMSPATHSPSSPRRSADAWGTEAQIPPAGRLRHAP